MILKMEKKMIVKDSDVKNSIDLTNLSLDEFLTIQKCLYYSSQYMDNKYGNNVLSCINTADRLRVTMMKYCCGQSKYFNKKDWNKNILEIGE